MIIARLFLNASVQSRSPLLKAPRMYQWCSFSKTSLATTLSSTHSTCRTKSANASLTTRLNRQLPRAIFRRPTSTPSTSLHCFTSTTPASAKHANKDSSASCNQLNAPVVAQQKTPIPLPMLARPSQQRCQSNKTVAAKVPSPRPSI